MNAAVSRRLFFLFLAVILAAAVWLRLPGLALRPMHHDEANQALKFGALLERGEYRYDKTEHHGPSLYYLTLPVAWLSTRATLASLDEAALRTVPLIFGSALILLLLVFEGALSRPAILFAGLLIALSPAFAYYSRFYIQEMIFVFFMAAFLGSLWRAVTRPSTGWTIACGFSAGMMFATKETSVVVFAAAAAGLALTRLSGRREKAGANLFTGPHWHRLFLGLAVAVLTSAVFFSSFFKNPAGIVDSAVALRTYLLRGAFPGLHTHPWTYYLGLLAYSKSGSGPVWTEALILVLALAGSLAAFRRKSGDFLRFVFFTTVLTAAVYSLIPYKTPWNVLPLHLGFIILAGSGAAAIFRSLRNNAQKTLVGCLLFAGLAHLGWEAARANFRDFANPRNPYVYAQTSLDFLKLVRRVEEAGAVSSEHGRTLIKVVCGPYETWPLPWYLRRFDRVGYWTSWSEAGGFDGVSAVIASQDQAERLGPELEGRFQAEYYGLRPGALLTLFIREDLWDRLVKYR